MIWQEGLLLLIQNCSFIYLFMVLYYWYTKQHASIPRNPIYVRHFLTWFDPNGSMIVDANTEYGTRLVRIRSVIAIAQN